MGNSRNLANLLNNSGDLTVDTSTLHVDAANNRVGIGTASPSTALLDIFTGSTTADGLKINRFASGTYYSTLRQASHGLAIHAGDGSSISERAAITPNGITFNGDTAAANALDDYDTGTWNPALRAATTNPTYTEDSIFAGTYVKIGAAVTVWFDLNMDITNAGSGQALVAGLPFPPDHGSNQGYSALQLRNTTSINVANGTYLTGWGYGVNSNIYIESNVTNTGSPTWNTGNNLRMTGFFHYQTTS